MQMSVTFRHIPPSEPLKEYASAKAAHVLSKFIQSSDVEAHIVLSVERFWHLADFTISFGGTTVKAEERSEDMYSSIDLAMDKIERQVRRYKDKLRDHDRTAMTIDATEE